MRQIISHLKKKPDHHKRAIAFGVSLTVSLLIFSVWFTTQPFFHSEEVIIAEARDESPLSIFGEALASAIEGIKNIFN